MNEFSSKALLLLAALRQFEGTPKDWKPGLINGMFWLIDQLLAATEGHAEHDYEHRSLKTIQQYVEQAFKSPEHEISDMAKELCARIVCGVSDNGEHA